MVARFRVENYNTTGDLSVDFTDAIEKDLERRDFTVNSIAMNYKKEFIDPFAGISDIQNRLLRSLGNPSIKFQEDPLRILRV